MPSRNIDCQPNTGTIHAAITDVTAIPTPNMDCKAMISRPRYFALVNSFI